MNYAYFPKAPIVPIKITGNDSALPQFVFDLNRLQ